MSNCPKCGNPMQEGTTKCPICGTDILAETAATPVAEAPAPEAPAPAPVEAPAPAPAPAPAEAPAPAAPAPAPVPAPEPAPVAPAPTAEAAPAEAPVQPGAIAPTVERVEMTSPVPGIPTSISTPGLSINEEKPLVENPASKPKKKKTPLIILVVVLIAVAVATYFALVPPKKKNNNMANNGVEDIELMSMTSNGYRMKLAEKWVIIEDGSNVVVTNDENTVVMKLEHTAANLANTNESNITSSLDSRELYRDVEVTSVNMSGRDSFLVNAKLNEMPIQVYLINGGSNLVLGVTIVYQSNDSKTKYEAEVTAMVSTLSYAEDTTRAIDAISAYEEAFRSFGIVTNEIPRNKVEEPATPEPEPAEEEPTEPSEEPPAEPETPDEPSEPEVAETRASYA